MADNVTLAAEARTEFGKGHARRARAAHKIPAVIYGHGADPLHVLLPGHDTMMALKHSNALLTITWDGKSELVMVKDVQRDAVKRSIDHVDLLIVKKGEKIAVDVAVHVTGEPISGNVAVQEHNSLHVFAEATHVPESFTVSVEGLGEGAHITAGQVELPKGIELLTDADALIVAVSATRGSAAGEEAEGEAAAAEAAE